MKGQPDRGLTFCGKRWDRRDRKVQNFQIMLRDLEAHVAAEDRSTVDEGSADPDPWLHVRSR